VSARRFVDSDVLLHSISREPGEAAKRERAVALLRSDDLALSLQVLQEFYVQATDTSRPDALAHDLAAGLGGILRSRIAQATRDLRVDGTLRRQIGIAECLRIHAGRCAREQAAGGRRGQNCTT
jgi:hypothetical protein